MIHEWRERRYRLCGTDVIFGWYLVKLSSSAASSCWLRNDAFHCSLLCSNSSNVFLSPSVFFPSSFNPVDLRFFFYAVVGLALCLPLMRLLVCLLMCVCKLFLRALCLAFKGYVLFISVSFFSDGVTGICLSCFFSKLFNFDMSDWMSLIRVIPTGVNKSCSPSVQSRPLSPFEWFDNMAFSLIFTALLMLLTAQR